MPYLSQRNVLQQLFDSKPGTLDYKFEVFIAVIEFGNKQLNVNNEQRLDLMKYSV